MAQKKYLAKTLDHFAETVITMVNRYCIGFTKCERVIVSTDDPEIASIGKAGGAEIPFLRPAALASDNSPGIAPVLHALEKLNEVSEILLLQPTSPLRSVEDVEGIIAKHRQTGYDSIVSITQSEKHPEWMFKMSEDQLLLPVLDGEISPGRQQMQRVYALNDPLYRIALLS